MTEDSSTRCFISLCGQSIWEESVTVDISSGKKKQVAGLKKYSEKAKRNSRKKKAKNRGEYPCVLGR